MVVIGVRDENLNQEELGVIAIADSRIETVSEITDRLQTALKNIDADRLIVAPDCGSGYLGREPALAKLTNMVSAAKSVGKLH